MNLASALIKQIITQKDIDTWSNVREHYLPGEFRSLFGFIEKHIDAYKELPSFDDLKLSIRDRVVQEKLYSIESIEVDSDANSLLEYLKNEYAQILILDELDKYVDISIAMSSAQENIESLHDIIMLVEDKVDLEDPSESMQSIELFDSVEDIANYIPLGLNQDFDLENKFKPTDLVLVGGPKGTGKSVVCSNIADSVYQTGKSAIYFTIEMQSREILQRQCAISTGVNLTRLQLRDLNQQEWIKVVTWWANRFEDGKDVLDVYHKNNDFDEFHKTLIKRPLSDHSIDIVHDSKLTLSKIKNTLDVKLAKGDYGAIVIDYINQITTKHKNGQYDWTAQIEIAKELKSMAQDYGVLVFSAYQTDDSGMARFSKGILDAPDAVYSLNAFTHEDGCMSFNCEKARGRPPSSFTSEMDWSCIKIGPRSALSPLEKKAIADSMNTGEDADDIDDTPLNSFGA